MVIDLIVFKKKKNMYVVYLPAPHQILPIPQHQYKWLAYTMTFHYILTLLLLWGGMHFFSSYIWVLICPTLLQVLVLLQSSWM